MEVVHNFGHSEGPLTNHSAPAQKLLCVTTSKWPGPFRELTHPNRFQKSVDIADSIFAEIGRVFCTPRHGRQGMAPSHRVANVDPYVPTTEAERALKPLESFRECAKDCPEMIVAPAGEFTMGSPATEKGHNGIEGPQHTVTIARPFAVSKFEVTFEQWDACVTVGGCLQASDSG
jgi:hypothetical protein